MKSILFSSCSLSMGCRLDHFSTLHKVPHLFCAQTQSTLLQVPVCCHQLQSSHVNSSNERILFLHHIQFCFTQTSVLIISPTIQKYVVNFVTLGCYYIISYCLKYPFCIHIPNMTHINSGLSFKANIKSPLLVTLYCHSIQRSHSVLASPFNPWYVLYKSYVAYIAFFYQSRF